MPHLSGRTTLSTGLAALVLSVGANGDAAAQDLFGGAVALSDGQVLVAKPSATRGPAAIYRYNRSGDGGWELSERMRSPTGADAGEGFSRSLAWSGGQLLVGSGDPDAVIGAHVFEPAVSEWSYLNPVRLRVQEERRPAGGIDLGTVMRILQPPPRIVSAAGDRGVVAVTGAQTPGGAGVHALAMSNGDWVLAGSITPPDGAADPMFGAAVAMSSNHLLIGSPGQGRVYGYAWSDAGAGWEFQTELASGTESGANGFGQSLAVDGETALVGVPGAEKVVAFRFDGSTWAQVAVLEPSNRLSPTGFGSAVALADGEAWVGTPLRSDRAGGVERFAVADNGEWPRLGRLALEGARAGYATGSTLALDGTVGVVGAPLADGATGRAAIVSRSDDGDWGEPVWVDPGFNLATVAGGEVRCEDGEAAGFECADVDLLAFLSLETLGAEAGERVSDVWGWTDPNTRREYALVGRTGGAAIVDVTDPTGPSLVGTVRANPSGARDLKVYADHLFFTGDGAGDHGLVVFDLMRLRDAGDTPGVFEPDAVYDGIASAHNLVIDLEAGFAYPVGASGGGTTCGGGLHMVDIRSPKAPVFAGCFTDTEGLIWQGRTHDAQCVIYRGPDQDFQGRQVCFVSNETALRIVDVTDKENPVPLGVASYPGVAYVHQGWLTEDHRYFYLNDELDELVGSTDRTKTLVWDVAELEDPVLIGSVLGPDGATDHNLYVKGNRMYQANYQAGFRVLDITDPEAPVEVGHFDTTPYEGNPPGFTGAWTAYPFFDSGTVVVSSMYEGLFLLRPVRRELIP